MRSRPSLADFIEEELLRVPLTFDAVVDAVYGQWRQSKQVQGRDGSVVARMLQLQRAAITTASLRSLRLAAKRSALGLPSRASPPAASGSIRLELVKEGDVVADLEIGRCVTRIRAEAEAELREIHCYTSALVGDASVSRETNPFRPEDFARALWDGAQALPASTAVRAEFVRCGTLPLSRSVREFFEAACQRLAANGVMPASYRTLVFPLGTGSPPRPRLVPPPENLNTLRDSLHGTLADAANPSGPHVRPAAAAMVDPQLEALMSRLYDDISSDSGLADDIKALLALLRASFGRVASRDEDMVAHFDHPVWLFIDRLVFTVQTSPPAERARWLGLTRNLIDHLDANPHPDADSFRWANLKLDALDAQSVALALRTAAPDIRRVVHAEVSDDTDDEPVALDFDELDTVPAGLEALDPSETDRGETLKSRPGDRLRIFLESEWHVLQLLWSRDDLWVLRELSSDRHWALRPGVVERLIDERLVMPLRVRSLVRRAAERVQQTL